MSDNNDMPKKEELHWTCHDCVESERVIEGSYQFNQMSLPNVRFAVKPASVTPPSITGRYQCTTQADRDLGYREWFKTVPAIYHEQRRSDGGAGRGRCLRAPS